MDRMQGNRANTSGRVLEKSVVSTFDALGFEIVKYRIWYKNKEKYGNELLLQNAPFDSIYGHKGNTEFLLKSKANNLEIRIECKWQQSPGSVDEKFPYLYLNCIEAMPEKDIILIIDGGGYKEGSLNWLKESIKNQKYQTENIKNIQVLSLSEFIIWANKQF